ncbi:molybdopterin molybdotransferase MoeA [Paracoccus sulfuroxidans]|uniref:Molybdopterin molybdenumtransferase n=1 Tax=Paracoccus sulfuroxidans TaxID=384678 RepID=A0A562NC38_9RHOB|nr:molybdopterin molybdotransferase MoeA [Paracoccus sulfuroxidans]TWI29687.1 molybdopterin molybdochelatase [Paracoccus sulfuroxidans]
MITVDEARALVLALAGPVQTEEIAIEDGLGRVMAAPATARLTQPPFNASAMDGYAVRSGDLPGPLTVIGTAAAGAPWTGSAAPGTAVRIFTGAPVPAGYDQVVIQEIVTREGDQITVAPAGNNLNIRLQGNDFAEGQAFQPQRRLRASDLALLAAMNVPRITVARRPTVAVMAGGDELVRPGETPGPGQIICSNDIAIAALARECGADARILPIARDTEESLRDRFNAASDADLIVTIGGASVGDHDLVGRVASELGMARSFYRLAMRPGKPLMAGRLMTSAMLGLPGNPVSAITCAKLFMQPLLLAMQGLPTPFHLEDAILARDLPPEGDRQHYLRAALTEAAPLPRLDPFPDQDSARLWLLAEADALLMRPAHDPARKAGETVKFIRL